MVEKVIRYQVQISNDLISSAVMCRSWVHRSKVFSLNENDPVFVRDGDIDLRDPLSILSVDRWSVLFPELEGEVFKLRILQSTLVEMS